MAMRLDQLARDLASSELIGDPGTEIASLAFDNRKVAPGALFFCVKGLASDGHDFAAGSGRSGCRRAGLRTEARPRGAAVIVSDSRAAMAPVAATFNDDPTSEMKLAGITGTNGKTTTAFLLRDILEDAGIPSGLMGTVKQIVGGRRGGGRANHPGSDRPPGRLPAHGRRRRRSLRDGGFLPRDGHAPRPMRSTSTWPSSPT